MNQRKINLKIIEFLRLNGFSQRWLARKAKLHETTVSLIINGRLIPTDDQQKAIALAMGSTPKRIFT
jgi:hypothetical protein